MPGKSRKRRSRTTTSKKTKRKRTSVSPDKKTIPLTKEDVEELRSTVLEELETLFSQQKFRRPVVENFQFKRDGKAAVRIASWNIERLSTEKVRNPGVLEILCLTILENCLSILVIQEIGDADVLEIVCKELNNPHIPLVKKFKGHRGSWRFSTSDVTGRMFRSSEYNGVLYDASQNIELIDDGLLLRTWKMRGKKKKFVRVPYLCTLKIDKFDCIIISTHLKATGLRNEHIDQTKDEIMRLPLVMDAIHDRFPGEKDIIVLGDFNMGPNSKDFDPLREDSYVNLIKKGQYTNISVRRPRGNKTYDNMWFSPQAYKAYTGHSGIVRAGLYHVMIPANEWSWGGLISDHCPIWAEVFTAKDRDKADLSGGVDNIALLT